MAEVSERQIGPVEYLVFAFPGNQFNGEIIPALMDLVDSGMVRVIDLAVVSKDADETVTIAEVGELEADVADALDKLDLDFAGLLSEADLMMVADALPLETTAAALMIEHIWATNFQRAIIDSNGWLVASARIPYDVVDEARGTLLEAAANA